jgi:uncharacterized protein (TIGR02246 family)
VVVGVVNESSAVQALLGEFNLAWTRKDSRRCGELFHEHGDLIALDGEVCHGPAAIAAYYERQLNGPYRDLTIQEPHFEDTRFLEPNLAVLNAQWKVVGFRNVDGSEREPTLARVTFVLTRIETGWCFAATRFMVPFKTGLA